MEIRFDGKIAVLTGAARGLGRAIAMMLAENGADVVIGDVLDEAGLKTCEEIKAQTGRQATLRYFSIAIFIPFFESSDRFQSDEKEHGRRICGARVSVFSCFCLT